MQPPVATLQTWMDAQDRSHPVWEEQVSPLALPVPASSCLLSLSFPMPSPFLLHAFPFPPPFSPFCTLDMSYSIVMSDACCRSRA